MPKGSCEKLHVEHLKVGKVVGGFAGTVCQAIEEAQKEKELDRAKIQKVPSGKDALLQNWTPAKNLSLTPSSGLRNRRQGGKPPALQVSLSKEKMHPASAED